MIWVILVFLGVPLWLCTLGILMVAPQQSEASSAPRRHCRECATLPWKTLDSGTEVWVSDVFAWRGSPAAWNEDLLHVTHLEVRTASAEDQKKLRRFG